MARHAPSWLESKTLDLENRASRHTTALRVWHILNHAVEAFINNNDLLRASALTFTVALSIVPILALAFSAVKGFGGAERLQPLVEQYLGLGSSGSQLMGYVENVNAAALGSAGGAFLLITVISTMGTVEQALNTIFNVPQSRSYFRKFSDYLSVLFTVPFLIVAALGFTAVFSVRISEFPFVTYLLPYFFVWAGFFFLFVFFPYTKVRYGPALIGSFVTAVLFQLAQWGYVRFQVGVANYRAIYGAMATLPIFLVWIYITSWTLSHELYVPEATIKPIIDGLKAAGFVIEADPGSGSLNQGLFLAREPSTIVLADAIKSVEFDRGASDGDPRVDLVLAKIDAVRDNFLKAITLEDIRSPEAKAVEEETVGPRAKPTAESA